MIPLRDRLAVVILTHNRSAELQRTLDRMLALPERPSLIVVDNASTDSTSTLVRRNFPEVKLVSLPCNLGAAARNIGVWQVETPYVAFCDDDTWWAEGALTHAADLLDAYPHVAVLSARVLVGPEEREDPTCSLMADSPLPAHGLPGPALLGFLAGAAVVRRHAFLKAGGYEPRLFIGGEEALLTLDLLMHGWHVVYAPQLTVHHYPSPARDAGSRRRFLIRNALWIVWLRRPFASVFRESWRICRRGDDLPTLRTALFSALRGLPWIFRKRRVIPWEIELLCRKLQQ